MSALPVPVWVIALSLAATAPFLVRTFAAQVDRRARERTRRVLAACREREHEEAS